MLWGATATGATPMLQSAAMCGAADHADGVAGSLAGGLLCERCVALMLTSAAGLMGVAFGRDGG